MREQRVGLHRSIRRIQRGGKLMAAFAGELEAFRRHGRSPRLGADLSAAVRPTWFETRGVAALLTMRV
jgi:hypothetical protein